MYSIAVSHLPPNIDEEDLVKHFARLLNCSPKIITNVSLAYNNRQEIALCFDRGALIKSKVILVHAYRHEVTSMRMSPEYDRKMREYDDYLEKQRQRMLAKIKDINVQLKNKEKLIESLANKDVFNRVIVAYITFDHAKYKDEILSIYNHMTIYDFLCSSKHLKLQDKKLKVDEAPEPSVIIWENLMFTRFQRVQRRLLTTFLVLLLLFVSLAMIFASKYLDIQNTKNGEKNNANSVCPADFLSMTDEEQTAFIEENPEYLHCYCDQFNPIDQANNSLCKHYLQRNVQSQVLIYFASFVILMINYAMETLLKILVKYEKHHTSDGMNNSIFYRLFFLKYINSAGIFLINNNNVILRSLFNINVSAVPGFTADWYNTIGVTIILVQIGDIINSKIDGLYKYWVYSRRKQQSELHPEKFLTQDELNASIIGPNFNFALNYSQLLTIIFTALTFSTGIPLLYPIACVNIGLFYLLEKYFFVKMYKIPPHFNVTVGNRVTFFIPLALCLHICMSIWMLSNHKLFTWSDQISEASKNGNENAGDGEASYYYYSSTVADHQFEAGYLKERMNNWIIIPLFITLGVVIFTWMSIIFLSYLKVFFNRVRSDFISFD
jgi:hypothetical protein